MSKTPFWCRVGFHSWFTDSSFIRSARRCNFCGKAENPAKVAALDAERKRISALPNDATIAEMYFAAASTTEGE